MRRNKYGNTKVVIDGIKFDSGKEGRRYLELKEMQRVGIIDNLGLQPCFLLQDKFMFQGKTIRKIEYFADFIYTLDGRIIIEDVKPSKKYQTDIYRLKKKLLFKMFPNINFREVY